MSATIINNKEPNKANSAITKLDTNIYKNITWAEISKRGTRGKANEDSILSRFPFFGLADGVGGGSFGEVASETCLNFCAKNQSFNNQDIIDTIINADIAVAHKISSLSDKLGASTLACFWLKDNIAKAIHVGDARIMYFSKQKHWKLKWQSKDQIYQYLDIIPSNVNPEDPYAMLGTGAVGSLEIKKIGLKNQDILVLCSDGLHKFLSSESISYSISSKLKNKTPLKDIAQSLVDQALKNGSYDDISLLILQYYKPWFNFSKNFLGLISIILILIILTFFIII